MIKNDPSQAKTVAALVVILVGAVGVTIWRIIPRDEVPAVTQQQPAAASEPACAAEPVSINVTPCTLTRDPFARPPALKAATRVDRQAGTEFMVAGNPWRDSERSAGTASVAPVLPPASGGEVEMPHVLPRAKPCFELLATVRSGKMYSAVIKSDQTESMVVEVGDKIDGRYRVVRIEPNRAVLSDGRDRIIAKRPQS